MVIIYNLIFLLISLVYLPSYLFKRKFHSGFFLRLGFLPKDLTLERPIWIHAVSVGEVMAAKYLIEKLRIAYPERRFVISTVTPTGNKIAKTIAKEADFVAYLPLDLGFIVKTVVDKINPLLFVAMETEIWPNLISYLYKKNIPVVIVNARISDRSFKGYLSIKLLLRPILNKINLFCVQTQTDAERLACLGVFRDRIEITGNMKFDNLAQGRDSADYRLKLGLKDDEKFIVAGSTHDGEEEIILDVYKDLLADFPALKLLIAPRHPERTNQVEKIVIKNGFNSLRVSQLNSKLPTPNSQPIFILDTVGQLLDFYRIADIVFVGGSLIRKGGHNILEPAALGKPVVFGPHMFNFRDIASLFLKNRAGILVQDKEGLKSNIRGLLNNPERIGELSRNARSLILQNQGATVRNLEYIKTILS